MIHVPSDYIAEASPEARNAFFSMIVKDDDANPVEFGIMYGIKFDIILDNPEAYKPILTLWGREKFPAKNIFRQV